MGMPKVGKGVQSTSAVFSTRCDGCAQTVHAMGTGTRTLLLWKRVCQYLRTCIRACHTRHARVAISAPILILGPCLTRVGASLRG